jgi:alpha-beta hydrolase superfamily lysophospholipase
MEFDWKTRDGLVFPCRKWEAEGKPRAILACVHGLSGSPMEFEPVGKRGTLHGLSTYAFSLRGQGNDPRKEKRGAELDLRAIETDLADFTAMVRDQSGDAPLFLCGESMGSLILMHAKLPPQVEGVIFSVPVVDMRQPVTPLVRKVMDSLVWLLPTLRIRPSLFVTGGKRPKITRDEVYAQDLWGRPSQIRTFTAKFLHMLGELIFESAGAADRFREPSLVLAGGNDCFVTTAQVEKWFVRLGSRDKTLKVYPESYHLLWNDLDHEVVLDDIIHWVESRLANGAGVGAG